MWQSQLLPCNSYSSRILCLLGHRNELANLLLQRHYPCGLAVVSLQARHFHHFPHLLNPVARLHAYCSCGSSLCPQILTRGSRNCSLIDLSHLSFHGRSFRTSALPRVASLNDRRFLLDGMCFSFFSGASLFWASLLSWHPQRKAIWPWGGLGHSQWSIQLSLCAWRNFWATLRRICQQSH